DAGERWVIVLGIACGASVVAALLWRIRAASRQVLARTAHALVPGVPPKHLALGGRQRAESRRV
ncbi:MAG TPA: hypothetical protein VH137_10595, partial [Gemmatimonadales bacterium]|nr:hypothetical protein [Gemmatimonadales bacterium]